MRFIPEYAAIGSVTTLASRFYEEAEATQIVVGRRVYGMVVPQVEAAPRAELNLKRFNHPVLAVAREKSRVSRSTS